MSTTPNSDAGSHLTIEDAGSTTRASDLFDNDTTARPDPGLDRRAAAPDEAAPDRAASDEGVTGRPDGTAVGGSTSDSGSEPGAPSAPGAPEPPQAPSEGRAALVDDYAIGHVFDQTNGMIDRLDGDSDGSAESDVLSGAERGAAPAGVDDALVEGDDDGVADLRDQNP